MLSGDTSSGCDYQKIDRRMECAIAAMMAINSYLKVKVMRGLVS